MSTTRWSARIESVRPVSAHLPGILSALEDLEKLNLTAEIRSEIHGIKSYVESFQCILMASIWVKVLTAIDYRNKVLQARSATLDVEVENIQSLIEDLKQLRKQWDAILFTYESWHVIYNSHYKLHPRTLVYTRKVAKCDLFTSMCNNRNGVMSLWTTH